MRKLMRTTAFNHHPAQPPRLMRTGTHPDLPAGYYPQQQPESPAIFNINLNQWQAPDKQIKRG